MCDGSMCRGGCLFYRMAPPFTYRRPIYSRSAFNNKKIDTLIDF